MDNASQATPVANFDVFNITEVFTSEPKRGLINDEQLALFSKGSVVAWLLLSLFGICTNVINIRTFIRMVPDDSVTILFLALAISDFSICTISLGEAASSVFDIIARDFSITWTLPPNIPRLYLFTMHRILSVVTIFITSFLALQRCLCIIIPFHVKGMFSKRLTYIFLAAVFTFASVPYCIYVAQYKVVKYVDPATKMTRYRLGYRALRTSVISFTSIGMGVVVNVAAQVVINTCIVIMRYGLNKSTHFRKMAASTPYQTSTTTGDEMKTASTSGNKERQAIVQVSIVSIIFVLTNSPYLLIALAVKIEPRIDLYSTYKNLFIIMIRIMSIVEIINSSFNFFIYIKYNSKFKKICFQAGNKK